MKQPQARAPSPTGRMIQAGLLTWILPGLGHYALGHRGLAVVFFLAISFPYWTGLAIGGIRNSVNPWSNRWLFLAELGTGGYTTACLLVNQNVGDLKPQDLRTPDAFKAKLKRSSPAQQAEYRRQVSFYPESDVATIYLATAGLLNLLAILDALARAQTGGLPTFHRELAQEAEATGERG